MIRRPLARDLLLFSFLFSSLLFFFLHMRHRDHRATKVEQTLPGEEGKENRCRGGKRDRGEREREGGGRESLPRNELRTIFISHD